ncbi:MAG: hypothetical protein IPN94_15435 [Sphingobacteriales bacterium]|nr:hypothetical protein [Sphingobacteriales bacterium]
MLQATIFKNSLVKNKGVFLLKKINTNTSALFFFVFLYFFKKLKKKAWNLEKNGKGYIPLQYEHSRARNNDFSINNWLRRGSEVVAILLNLLTKKFQMIG